MCELKPIDEVETEYNDGQADLGGIEMLNYEDRLRVNKNPGKLATFQCCDLDGGAPGEHTCPDHKFGDHSNIYPTFTNP